MIKWGHDEDVVEEFPKIERLLCRSRLQWGHACSMKNTFWNAYLDIERA